MTDIITRAIVTDAIVNGVSAWKRNDVAAMDQAIDTAIDALRDARPAGQDEITAAAGRIMDVFMGGRTGWRERMDESLMLGSADWARAVQLAEAALRARTQETTDVQ